MTLREIFVENYAGDLEYHPRRAVVYLALAVGAFCFWIFSASDVQFTTVPLVFALGSLALLIKGIFFCVNRLRGSDCRTENSLGSLTHPIARASHPSPSKPAKSFRTSVPARFFCGQFSISARTSTNHGVTLRCSEYFSLVQFSSSLAGPCVVLLLPRKGCQVLVSRLLPEMVLDHFDLSGFGVIRYRQVYSVVSCGNAGADSGAPH